MATHSSTLGWRIPWTEGAGGLRFMGSRESDTTERLKHPTARPRGLRSPAARGAVGAASAAPELGLGAHGLHRPLRCARGRRRRRRGDLDPGGGRRPFPLRGALRHGQSRAVWGCPGRALGGRSEPALTQAPSLAPGHAERSRPAALAPLLAPQRRPAGRLDRPAAAVAVRG